MTPWPGPGNFSPSEATREGLRADGRLCQDIMRVEDMSTGMVVVVYETILLPAVLLRGTRP